jgi:hypothetical protein
LIVISFCVSSCGEVIVFFASMSISFIAATRSHAEPVAKSHTKESLFTRASLTRRVAT